MYSKDVIKLIMNSMEIPFTGIRNSNLLEWFGTKVVSEMVLQMVLVLCDKGAFRALQDFVIFDVGAGMGPIVLLLKKYNHYISTSCN